MNKIKKRIKNSLILLACLCILKLVLVNVFFVNYQVLITSILFLLDILMLVIYFFVTRSIQLKDDEKIKEANRQAVDTVSYVSSKMPMGIVVWNDKREIDWLNSYADQMFTEKNIDGKEFATTLIELLKSNKDTFKLGRNTYRVSFDAEKQLAYFFDITEEETIKARIHDSQPVVGVLSFDNYDDAVDKMDDKEISYFNSFLTTLVSDWMEDFGVYVKRLNAEKYFFISRYEDLTKMKEKKFDLLDILRKEAENQNFPITISIGISFGEGSLDKIGDVAQNNLDMALIRGGDQVVIKDVADNAKPMYFGGKSSAKTKRTRVRSRAISTALQRIFSQATDIYIMGHRYPDMDALGSAYGVYALAEFSKKEAWIVLDQTEIIPDVQRCLQEIHKVPELEQRLVSPEDAMKNVKENSLLVMVDYHKPSLSISEKLYEKFQNIVIIDHHRRGEEFPENPLLTYIESSASSASELVAELVQQQSSQVNYLDKMEATLLLAGMVVDTKSFEVRTSARTFDFASYLRSVGADAPMIRYLISTDLSNYLEISSLIAKSEFVTSDIVVANGAETAKYDSVTAAKTADTLLSMYGINAAFVITKRTDGLIGISARSSGTINVQMIMEKLNGGGHFNNAATQLSDMTIDQAKEVLLKAINENINELYEEE
ncbi:DHH family phosphoesterase [Enterococcus sp. LJL90]